MTYRTYSTLSLAIGCVVVVAFFALQSAEAKTDSYPRLANYYLSGGAITMDEARQLSRMDLIITGFEVPYESPEAFNLLKQLNPSIILLPYLNSISRHEDFPVEDQQNPRYQQRLRSRDEWLLKSGSGEPMGFWPGAQIMNPTDFAPLVGGMRWNDFVGTYGKEMTGLQKGWDGIYFDDAMSTISWLNQGKIDINNDGLNDEPRYIDAQWQTGLKELFRHARTLMGPQTIFVTNSSNTYEEFTNGRLYEAAFWSAEDWHSQIDQFNHVLNLKGAQPRIVVVNATSNNDGNWQDWRRFRFAYTSTLLTDAYFSFDFGDKWHDQIWWYDEYDADLGMPRADSYELERGAWRRDFEHSIALVNPTSQTVTVKLESEYQRLDGTQDRIVNNGQKTSSITLPPYDGILLKRLSTASLHTIRWSKGALTLYRNGTVQWTMYPYDNRWRGAVSMAAGDLDGDGSSEIILAAGPGGGPHIRVVGIDGKLKGPGFFAYDKRKRSGASVSLADRNGDGVNEILVSSGRGESQEVKAFDQRGSLVEQLDPAVHYRPFSVVENLVF